MNSVFQNSEENWLFVIHPSYGPYNPDYPYTEMLFMIKRLEDKL